MHKSALIFLLALSGSVFAQDQQTRWSKWEAEADTLMNHQDYSGAAAFYSKIIAECQFKEKMEFKYIYKRAVSYYSDGAYDSALADMNRFVPEFPESPQ